VYLAGVQSYIGTAVTHARNRVNGTDGGPTVTHTSNQSFTDVVVMDQYYTGTWAGLWSCVAVHPSGNCEKGEMRFDQNDLDGATQQFRNTLACQEFGHSLGLDHSSESNSCLRDGASISNSDYSPHDKSHINGLGLYD